jgi:SOS response regulatory protein OraA/RecX
VLVLARSKVDAQFWELCKGNEVIWEVKIAYPLPKNIPTFSDIEKAKAWIYAQELISAKKKAFRLLSLRSYNSLDLSEKLRQIGISPLIIEKTIQDCKRLGFLDDNQFWERWILKEFKKGYGPHVILRKKRGVPKELVFRLITPQLQREKINLLKTKGLSSLARRGFDSEILVEIFRM